MTARSERPAAEAAGGGQRRGAQRGAPSRNATVPVAATGRPETASVLSVPWATEPGVADAA
ncbi:hypothetical protein GCM10025868_12820 [Angustibacter aerolatus]|uniref:Uncharacterized protein n=1 Tax=Angustibacter aerolatus TaxID=1162965 RepID=A0ABQ6JE20_9ACTN|nr:hypothetical protein GCM10025868_12820 [Angustibacter aerolatus]